MYQVIVKRTFSLVAFPIDHSCIHMTSHQYKITHSLAQYREHNVGPFTRDTMPNSIVPDRPWPSNSI